MLVDKQENVRIAAGIKKLKFAFPSEDKLHLVEDK
jgi:hypothetical protein